MTRTTSGILALMLVSATAWADDAALLKCRAISEASARLACYDALARQVEGRFGAPPKAASPTPGPAAPATAAPAPRAVPQQTPERFGFENLPQPGELQSIQSHIAGRFEGWRPNSRIQLANGQVWQVSDGSSVTMWEENPKVTVRRGAFGSFFLDIANDNRSPRVRRVQ